MEASTLTASPFPSGEAGFTYIDLNSYEVEIASIERAMSGLIDGSYGRCSHCGASIEDDVIGADPLAIACSAHLPGSVPN